MKLELKHLAPYLPYGLEAIREGFEESQLVVGIELPCVNHDGLILIEDDEPLYLVEAQLALRPLSDLTKEIKHNGDKFVPLDKLHELTGFCRDTSEKVNDWTMRRYDIVQKLFEWHFDVFGLIDKGLAIDMKTIKETNARCL